MSARLFVISALAVILLFVDDARAIELACCPAPRPGQSVVNADQTVIIVWDPIQKIEHFIRRATFKTEASDFGFLIPTPNQPELEESGDQTFPFLATVTAPLIEKKYYFFSPIGCGEMKSSRSGKGVAAVVVLEQKQVAGFDAAVLEASSAKALVAWLTEKGYAMSPEIEAWAKPYIDAGWKITAFKVAGKKENSYHAKVDAPALRMSFKTDRPLFPYREPDYKKADQQLHIYGRLLRIYFISDARYTGELTKESPWTGKPVWSDRLNSADRKTTLSALKLPESAVPANGWMTEFEDPWPFTIAPADLYFSRDTNQTTLMRPTEYDMVYVPGVEQTVCCGFPLFLLGLSIWLVKTRLLAKKAR